MLLFDPVLIKIADSAFSHTNISVHFSLKRFSLGYVISLYIDLCKDAAGYLTFLSIHARHSLITIQGKVPAFIGTKKQLQTVFVLQRVPSHEVDRQILICLIGCG